MNLETDVENENCKLKDLTKKNDCRDDLIKEAYGEGCQNSQRQLDTASAVLPGLELRNESGCETRNPRRNEMRNEIRNEARGESGNETRSESGNETRSETRNEMRDSAINYGGKMINRDPGITDLKDLIEDRNKCGGKMINCDPGIKDLKDLIKSKNYNESEM